MTRRVKRLAAVGLLSLFCLVLLSVLVFAPASQAAPLAAQTATVTPVYVAPTATPQPCPANTVDLVSPVNQNNGGIDCQPIDPIPAPTSCTLVNSPAALVRADGAIFCRLPFAYSNGVPVYIIASPGCVDVQRTPFPWGMVGVGAANQDFRMSVVVGNVIPVEDLGLGLDYKDLGWYSRVNETTVVGPTLGEFYQNQEFFNTADLLPATDPYRFPSIRNVRAQIRMMFDPITTSLSFPAGLASYQREADGITIKVVFNKASFPLPGLGGNYSSDGPDPNGSNRLPSYRMRAISAWQAEAIMTWENWGAVNGVYTRTSPGGDTVSLGSFTSARAWDTQQTDTAYHGFCNASTTLSGGYIPVPVLEAQAILAP